MVDRRPGQGKETIADLGIDAAEELGVQAEDLAMISTAIEALLTKDNTEQLKVVFAAAMLLAQGPVTLSKVEVLLEAVGMDKQEVLGMVGRAANPLVQRKLEELGVPHLVITPDDASRAAIGKNVLDPAARPGSARAGHAQAAAHADRVRELWG